MAYQQPSKPFEHKELRGALWKNPEWNPNGDDQDPENYYAQGNVKIDGKVWNQRIYVNTPDPEKPKRPQFNIWCIAPGDKVGKGGEVKSSDPDDLPF